MLLSQKVIPVIVFTLFAAIVVFAFGSLGVMQGAVIVLFTPILIRLLTDPRRALLFSWWCLVFLPLPIRMYVGSMPYYAVNELVIIIVWISWFATFLVEKGTVASGVPRPLAKLALFIFLISALSAVVNRTNPLYWLEWVLSYLLPYPVLGISRRYLKDYSARRACLVILGVLLFQVLLNLTWHAGINPLRNGHIWLDLSCGTYGNTGATAYIFVAVLGGLLCYYAASRMSLGKSIVIMLLLLCSFVQLFFTFTTHAYVFLPIAAFLPVVFRGGVRTVNPVRMSMKILLAVMVLMAFLIPLSNKTVTEHHRVIGPSVQAFTVRLWDSVWHGPKVGVIRRVAREARPLQLLVGMGPNTGVSYTGFLLKTPQTLSLVGDWFYTFSGRDEISTGSIRESLFSGTAMLFSEIGLVGMTFYYVMLLVPIFHLFMRVRHYRDADPYRLFLIGAVFLLLIMNLIIGLVWDIWRIRMLSMTIWLLLGIIWDPPRQACAAAGSVTGVPGREE